MAFFDSFGKILNPYDDEDEDFDGAAPAPAAPAAPAQEAPAEDTAIKARDSFEAKFAANTGRFVDGDEPAAPAQPAKAPGQGLFGMLSKLNRREDAAPVEESTPGYTCAVPLEGIDGVYEFKPQSYDQSGELRRLLEDGNTVYLSLNGIEKSLAVRMIDFMNGITYAFDGKITPKGNNTFFITTRK